MITMIPKDEYRNYVMETEKEFVAVLNRITNIRLYSHKNFADLSDVERTLANQYIDFTRKIVDPLTK